MMSGHLDNTFEQGVGELKRTYTADAGVF